MARDLTTSKLDRQNLLNNDIALREIQRAINIKCICWNDRLYLTKDMVASFFDVETRTIERYISKYGAELKSNGYAVIKGEKLQEFLTRYKDDFVTDIDVGHKIRICKETPDQGSIFKSCPGQKKGGSTADKAFQPRCYTGALPLAVLKCHSQKILS